MEGAKETEKVISPTPTEAAAWGTRQMGPPAAPAAHPQNQEAAYWGPYRSEYEERPYVLQQPLPAPAQHHQSPMENILDAFNSWTRKAETLASNVWHNRKSLEIWDLDG